MSRKSNVPLLLLSLLIIFSLLAALNPASDIDHDGNLDSLITEGFLFVPLSIRLTALFSLLTLLPAAGVFALQKVSRLAVPPPIFN